MYKGWYSVTGRDAEIYPTQAGNTYYYDPKTGLMAKGWTTIDNRLAHFDEVTGVFTHYLDTNSSNIDDYLITVKITPENFNEYFEPVVSFYEEHNSFGEGTGINATVFGLKSKTFGINHTKGSNRGYQCLNTGVFIIKIEMVLSDVYRQVTCIHGPAL